VSAANTSRINHCLASSPSFKSARCIVQLDPVIRFVALLQARLARVFEKFSQPFSGKQAVLSQFCNKCLSFSVSYSTLAATRKWGTTCAAFYGNYKMPRATHKTIAAFTLAEAVVGIAVLGIGAACAVGALTRFNSLASAARNATGAYTAVMNQIDLIQSDSPFNPQKTNADGTAQIPPELQIGTHTQTNIPIYQDPKTGVIVSGTMTTAVSDISSTYTNGSLTFPLTMYKAVVTVTYTYLNRNYSFSMSTIRTSDI
jgi:type II secretory pathway pseudopilin PulG